MKKIMLSLAAVSALAATALPAAAQPWDPRFDARHGRQVDVRFGYGHAPGWNQRRPDVVRQLEWRIERAYATGQIARGDYMMLRQQTRQLAVLEARYLRDGVLTRWEREDLNRRVHAIETHLRRASFGGGWGYGRF
jgi:hypothetical protein